MLKTILIGIVAVVGLVLIYAATRPDTFRIERSVRIKASPERVYGLIDDLHQFNRWNPFLRKDPATQGTYSGTPDGKGARYAWQSEKIGVGQMEIVDTAAASSVTMKLDFLKPFEAHNVAEFELKPEAGETQVTWAMHGPAPFLSKLMQVFFSMDRMVGKDFEDGLSNLKTLAEAN